LVVAVVLHILHPLEMVDLVAVAQALSLINQMFL
jgi:hypothetical protein